MNHFPINSKFFKKSILLIFLMLPFIQIAQTEIQKDSVEVIPQAIEISEIANYSEETRNLIEETQELINNKSEVKAIYERLINLDSLMETKLVLLRDSLSYFTLDQIDKYEERITVYNNSLDAWQERISAWKVQTIKNKKRIES